MFTRGDFHIHSTASDGALSPGEIVATARSVGVDVIAITDHNSTHGVDEAAAAGSRYGVSVIPAVELSTRYKGESIHLLGYFRDGRYNDMTFQQILRLVRAHKTGEARRILSTFMYTDIGGNGLSIYEGITLLRKFGAAVVLAHPVRISPRNLQELLNMPFDGIEAKYCHNSYDDTSFFVNIALAGFSFYTGGSDFHRPGRKHQLHCFIGEPSLGPSEIQMFLANSGAAVLN